MSDFEGELVVGVRLLIVGTMLACSACGSKVVKQEAKRPDKLQVADAEAFDAIKSKLRDPGSAQFQKLRRIAVLEDPTTHEALGGRYYYCGEVNSKNAFGAYVGFTRFVVLPWPGKGPDDSTNVPGKGISVDIFDADDLASPIGIDPICGPPGSEIAGRPVKFEV